MDYANTLTTCIYCGCGCGIFVETIDGCVTGVWPTKEHAVTQGKLCIKGWNLHEYVNSFMRLKAPLFKTGGRFRRASWDQAIQVTAGRFKEIIAKHGTDSIGVPKRPTSENRLHTNRSRAMANG